MRLSSLLQFDEIYIQCHDNPDADSIGSGFGLYCYFASLGKKPYLFYSGKRKIQKSNLVMMVSSLGIPLNYTESIKKPELLILVDCQHRQGNVTSFEAGQIVIIDHHEVCSPINEWMEIQTGYGSCATVVYSLLIREEFNINDNPELATALCYALYMDTNSFSEIRHPLDLDMIKQLQPIEYVIRKLKHSNYTETDLKVAGEALIHYEKIDNTGCAVAWTQTCDSNLLGMIGDLILQADTIFTCIVFHETGQEYRFSVRSCRRDARADDIINFLTDRVGDGGGHKRKAGGFIRRELFEQIYGNKNVMQYLIERTKEYFTSYDIIDTQERPVNSVKMLPYQQLSVPSYFVRTADLASPGSLLIIRTVQGEITITSGRDVFIIVGNKGEIHPVKRERFEKNYYILGGPVDIQADYIPMARNKRTDEVYRLDQYCKTCIRHTTQRILAMQLSKTTKVFTEWYFEDYMLGKKGDYLVLEDQKEAFIIKEDVFCQNYQRLKE